MYDAKIRVVIRAQANCKVFWLAKVRSVREVGCRVACRQREGQADSLSHTASQGCDMEEMLGSISPMTMEFLE